MRRVTTCSVLALALSFSAAFISFHLLAKHMTGSSGAAWFDAGCSDDPTSTANCGAVLASPYSYWPVRREGEPEGTRRWPVALFGLFYYSALTVWLLAVGAPSRARRYVQLLPLALTTCGLLGSVYFVYVMFTKMDHWCLWCLVTHMMNLAIAALLVLMWPSPETQPHPAAMSRDGTTPARQTPRHDGSSSGDPPPRRGGHPTFRLAATGMLAACAVIWGQYQLYSKGSFAAVALENKQAFQQCRAMVDRLKADTSNLIASWKNGEPCTIALRADDVLRTNTDVDGPTMQVVAFSDFECPSCKRFALFFESDIQPLFDNRLSLIFKHHPLGSECNPRVARTMHAHACEAARMAEAARAIGGVDAFRRAHDVLFHQQADLEKGKLTPERLAERIGVNADELTATMGAADISQRIAEDIAQAATCNVTSTPTVYLDGKLVDTIPRGDIKFWDRVAEEFWNQSGLTRPEHTTLAHRNTIRGSPSRTTGP